jgi:hypothetical protein
LDRDGHREIGDKPRTGGKSVCFAADTDWFERKLAENVCGAQSLNARSYRALAW